MFFPIELHYNVMMVFISAIPLVIFHQINKNNRVMLYVYKKNQYCYYIMKALISILAITSVIYVKAIFA
jgi:hypothetical protein